MFLAGQGAKKLKKNENIRATCSIMPNTFIFLALSSNTKK